MNINVRWERVYSLIDEQSFMKVNDKMFQILASWLEHYWDFSHQPCCFRPKGTADTVTIRHLLVDNVQSCYDPKETTESRIVPSFPCFASRPYSLIRMELLDERA